ncbi:MAG: right-handed parallel beta-helix repeat-containing protein [Methanobacterium sp.]|nr:right-handed parallel beta-helix repeat-containing protein [Methanobacterium sp.]
MKTKRSQKVLFALLILLAAIILTGTASAATLDVGPSGHVYTTINSAVAAASPGDTIIVYDDNGTSYTYSENVNVDGVSDLNFTASGNVTVSADNASNPTFTVREDNTIISGFIISGATGSSSGDDAAGIRVRSDAANVLIINNIITGNRLGIYTTSGTTTIEGNLIYDNSLDGIRVENGNNNITNNEISENGQNGIRIEDGRNKIVSNDVSNNIYNGIYVNGCGDPTQIHFNRIVDNVLFDLLVEHGSWVDATNNWWGSNSPTYVRSNSQPSYTTDIWEHRHSYDNQRVSWEPYLVLKVCADPSEICNTQTSEVKAYLTDNSCGEDTSSMGHVPDGIIVQFSLLDPVLETVNQTDVGTVNGEALTTFTATTAGTQEVLAAADYEAQCATIEINPAASIVLNKTSNSPVNVRETGVFTVSITNNGPDDAQEVSLTDILVPGFTPGTPSQGTYDSETGIWTIGTLADGTTATLNFTKVMTREDSGTTFCNNATDFMSCTCMLDPVLNQQACIHVKKCNLSVDVTPTLINTTVGSIVTINYKVSNNGPDSANGVIINYVIPAGLEFISADSPDWAQPTYDAATRTLTWILGDVPVGDPVLNLNLRVLSAGSFNIAPTLLSGTCTGDPVIIAATTINAVAATAGGDNEVQAATTTTTVPMQTTGYPMIPLLLVGILVFAGMLLPKRL